MNLPLLLGQAERRVVNDVQWVPLDEIWNQITALTWLQAVIAVSFGLVYMLYGWRIFRILVVISFALIGMFLGIWLGGKSGNEILGGVVGSAILGGVSRPLMKWCVFILGGAAGALLTGGLWYAFSFPQYYLWAGAAVGGVAGAMISFIVIKVAVMLFTSVGGSVITVAGVLRLVDLWEGTRSPATEHIKDWIYNYNWFLPLTLIVPSLVGIFTQNRLIKQSSKWQF